MRRRSSDVFRPRKGRAGWLAVLGGLLAIGVWLWPPTARAFPGLCVSKTEARCVLHTTHVVLMIHEGFSVVTLMVDYEGPLEPFALVVPVPGDVRLERIETLRRAFISRLEEVSAPRFHAFYEQDPCLSGPVEQQWQERLRPRDRGFLTPPILPPPWCASTSRTR